MMAMDSTVPEAGEVETGMSRAWCQSIHGRSMCSQVPEADAGKAL